MNGEVMIWAEGAVVEALKTRYKSPEYALLPQVRNGTGFTRVARTADAIAMSLWPSRGLTLSGFEIKVRRGDWLSELRNPEKSIEIQQYCDEWWIAAPPSIVLIEELPVTWGLIEISEVGRTKIVKQAPQLNPKPITKEFLAAIFRGIDKYEAPLDAVDAARKHGFEEGKKSEQETNENLIKHVKRERDELLKSVETFEQSSGLAIRWDAGRVGDAVRLFMNEGEREHMKDSLTKLLSTAKQIVSQMETSIKDIDNGNRNASVREVRLERHFYRVEHADS